MQPYYSSSSPRRMSPRATIQKAPAKHISYLHKALLAEIVELHSYGNMGGCFADNDHLADALGTTAKTISAAVQELKNAGWVLVVKGKFGRRQLAPSQRLERLLSGEEVEPIGANPAKPNPVAVEICPSKVEVNPLTVEVNPSKVEAPYREELTTNSQGTDSEHLAADAAEPPTAKVVLPSVSKKPSRAKPASSDDPLKGKGKHIEDAYVDWYSQRNGVEPKLKFGADQKAAKEIFGYLLSQSKDKSDIGVVLSFKYILNNWDSLGTFLQEQVDLYQINHNLNKIINHLRNGKPTAPTRAAELGLVDNSTRRASLDVLRELS